MGNCTVKQDNYDPTVVLSRQQFAFLYPIGRGGFSKVWKVVMRKNKQQYAMKEMLKARIISKRSVHSVMNERRLLQMIKHPFIVNMQYAFQCSENLYLVMDLMPGGDLRYHLGRQRRFSEDQVRFFVACLFCALEYLHVNSIIHRDIKPENLVLDEKGYVRLTDFGIARIWQEENGHETSGTPGYMAPEVICRQNHTTTADYFALGVIVYEFMTGRRPYVGKTRNDIRNAILARQVQLKTADMPQGWSLDALDFTNKLLQRKPQNRLGFGGPQEVKNHAWLKDVDWGKLLQKKMDAPFVPKTSDNFDAKQMELGWNDEVDKIDPEDKSTKEMFIGYFYDPTLSATTAKATSALPCANYSEQGLNVSKIIN